VPLDDPNDTVEIGPDEIAAEVEDSIPAGHEVGVTASVQKTCSVSEVSEPVGFDDESPRETNEVGDERPDRLLPPKAMSQSVSAEHEPESKFIPGLILSILPSKAKKPRISLRHNA
jgi:hypothetical protein